MKSLFFYFISLYSFSIYGREIIQSRFYGPVKLHVWEHWQPSWNVERDESHPIQFELVRGYNHSGKTFIRLTYFKKMEDGWTVRFGGVARKPNGPYSDFEKLIPGVVAPPKNYEDVTVFELETSEFIDIPGKNIVTEIEFEIRKRGELEFHYRLTPMFVRGSKNYHWKQTIDGYTAHAGEGSIVVSNGTSAEGKLDYWNGVLVQPRINYIDLDVLNQGKIGLHRHVENQEIWLVYAGSVFVTQGIAPLTGSLYKANRKFSDSESRDVNQIDALGGYFEERSLTAGEYSIIVPNPSDRGTTVCAHGLVAEAGAVIFSMGGKN